LSGVPGLPEPSSSAAASSGSSPAVPAVISPPAPLSRGKSSSCLEDRLLPTPLLLLLLPSRIPAASFYLASPPSSPAGVLLSKLLALGTRCALLLVGLGTWEGWFVIRQAPHQHHPRPPSLHRVIYVTANAHFRYVCSSAAHPNNHHSTPKPPPPIHPPGHLLYCECTFQGCVCVCVLRQPIQTQLSGALACIALFRMPAQESCGPMCRCCRHPP
jgi:hypothetical protein